MNVDVIRLRDRVEMGRLATYIAIEGNRLESLWSLDDDDFREAFLDVENDDSLARLEIDKIWDALHCTLTGESASNPIDGDKLSESIVGVHPKIYDDEDYSVFVSVIDNSEIQEILNAIMVVDREKLASLIDPTRMKQKNVYPNGIWNDSTEQLVSEMDSALQSIRTYFEHISGSGLHILATVL